MFKIEDGRDCFYQWDLDRRLIVEDKDIPEVHFCNKTGDCSLVCETYTEDGVTLVNVPNILLQDDWKIHCYAYDKNYTKHTHCFNIISRTKPADYVYTETEIKTIEALEEKVKELEASNEDTTERLEKLEDKTNLKVGTLYADEIFKSGEKLATETQLANARTFGYENKNYGEKSITLGTVNETSIDSKNSVLIGALNKSSAERTYTLGSNNTVTGKSGYQFIVGYGNNSSYGQGYLIGKQLVNGAFEQVVLGRNNEQFNNAILIVGNGTGTSNRLNALEILKSTNDMKLAAGVILTSPNGTMYKLTVNNDGTLKSTPVTIAADGSLQVL